MRRPAVFISSTCYDLRQLRADLHAYCDGAGLEPILSEFPTFPVSPDIATAANCQTVIDKRADILVLVIGGRYGSINEHGKSITNLEYLSAKAKGIPIYIFVMRSILDILPVWIANQNGDFSSVVDSPKLFEFVKDIRNSREEWVFPFDIAQDIVNILRLQFAYLFSEALELRRRAAGSEALSDKYRTLTASELRLMIERSPAWEYLLFGRALDRELKALQDLRRDWKYGITIGSARLVTPKEFIHFAQTMMSEMLRISKSAELLFNASLPAALGPPGVPGNVDDILYTANRLGSLYKQILEWKLAFYSLALVEDLNLLRDCASRMCDQIVTDIEDFSQTYEEKVVNGMRRAKSGEKVQIDLLLTFSLSSNLNDFHRELNIVSSRIQSGKIKWE